MKPQWRRNQNEACYYCGELGHPEKECSLKQVIEEMKLLDEKIKMIKCKKQVQAHSVEKGKDTKVESSNSNAATSEDACDVLASYLFKTNAQEIEACSLESRYPICYKCNTSCYRGPLIHDMKSYLGTTHMIAT